MSALDLQRMVSSGVAIAFELAARLVRSCLFEKGEAAGLGSGLARSGSVSALFVGYHSGDIDGTMVKVGDEKAFIRAKDFAGVFGPGAGDYLTENDSGLRRSVVAGRLDPTRAVWVLQVRRVEAEDRGTLSVLLVTGEDLGGLGAAMWVEDWGG
jgi:hypothetical protein